MKSQTFGEKIKYLREKNGYSLKYVGAQIKYDAAALSKIEKNQKTAPEKIIKPLSKVLKIAYKELMIKYLDEKIFYAIKNADYATEALKVVEKRLKKEGMGTREVKAKEEIINLIRSYFNNKPIEKAWIFGSFARNTSLSFDSDIDILIQFKRPNKITLFDIIEMKKDLSDKTGREIDLVEEGQALNSIKKEIEKEKILVYGN